MVGEGQEKALEHGRISGKQLKKHWAKKDMVESNGSQGEEKQKWKFGLIY